MRYNDGADESASGLLFKIIGSAEFDEIHGMTNGNCLTTHGITQSLSTSGERARMIERQPTPWEVLPSMYRATFKESRTSPTHLSITRVVDTTENTPRKCSVKLRSQSREKPRLHRECFMKRKGNDLYPRKCMARGSCHTSISAEILG